jgi:hypothetical protein
MCTDRKTRTTPRSRTWTYDCGSGNYRRRDLWTGWRRSRLGSRPTITETATLGADLRGLYEYKRCPSYLVCEKLYNISPILNQSTLQLCNNNL